MTTSLPERPYLKPWVKFLSNGECVLLESGQRVVAFTGGAARKLLPVLLPLLDGERSLAQLVEHIGPAVRPAVENVLQQLAGHGLLTDGPPISSAAPLTTARTAEYLSATVVPGSSPAEIHERLAAGRAAVIGSDPLAAQLAALLSASGVGAVEAHPLAEVSGVDSGPLLAVVPSPEERPHLGDWNRHALRAGREWFQVLPFDGRYAAVGPFYVPGDTCCYECFERRRAANLAYQQEFWPLAAVPSPRRSAPMLDACVAGLAATTLLRWLVAGDHFVPGAFSALEHGTAFTLTQHFVYRVPRCAACSGLADRAAPLPWRKEVSVAA